VSSDIKEKIIQHFVDYKNVWAVLTLKGEIDLDVIIWVKDIYEFYKFWDNILDKFEDYFSKHIISIYIEAFNYKKSYLLPEKNEEKDRLLYRTTCGGTPINIDQTDYSILNEIAINARMPLIELAEKLGCSSQSVNYRLKNLIKNGVINAFRVNVDLSKMGLQHYKLEIYLKDHKKRKAIWGYVKQKPYCDTLNVAVGWCDLEFEIVIEDVNKLGQVMDDLYTKFPDSIKKQTFWIAEKYYKERWLPELNQSKN